MKLTRNAIKQSVENSYKRSGTNASKTTSSASTSTVDKKHNVVTPDKKRKSSNQEDTIDSLKKDIYILPTHNLSDLDCSQQDSASSSTNKQSEKTTDSKFGNNNLTKEGMLCQNITLPVL